MFTIVLNLLNASEVINQDKNNLLKLTKDEQNYLKKKKKILMCVLPNWLPFEQIDKDGKHKGIGADLIKLVEKSIGTSIQLFPTKTWTQSLQNIKDRKCDILPVAMSTPNRRVSMNFTTPYVSEPFVIATQLKELFIKNAKALENKKIGIVRSYAFIEVLKRQNPTIQIVPLKNTKEGLEKVRNGELFGYVDTMPTIGYWIQKYSMMDLKIAGKLEFNIPLSIASRNDEPLLGSIMQKAIDNISDEQKRSIIGKWMTLKVVQEHNYTLLLQVSGLFLLIVVAVGYKNWAVSTINKKLSLANEVIEERQAMVDKYVLILATDLKGTITYVNSAYSKEIGYSPSELVGNRHSIIKDAQTNPELYKDLWKNITRNKTWTGEIRNITKSGEPIWFLMNIEPIYKDKKKIGYRSISQNITDKKTIEKLSITDQLTTLYNRHYLEQAFTSEINRALRYKTDLSLIMVDIDHFKLVNDTYGHEVGDETLKSLADILKSYVRKTDIVGRWGGEEFIILAPNTNEDEAVIVAQKIRIAIENFEFKVVGHKTASFGISHYKDNDKREDFVNKADGALYRAKQQGRNRVEVYN